MKLGLLVVLAVVVLVPSLSEGRTVSKCELRRRLDQAIQLPRRYQRVKERILAIVICNLSRRSHLNTGLVRVFGKRRTTTTKPMTSSPAISESMAPTPPFIDFNTTRPTTNGTMATRPTTNETMATRPTTNETMATRPTTNETMATRPMTTGQTPPTSAPMSPPSNGTNSTFGPGQASGNSRRKREVGTSSEESDVNEMEDEMDEVDEDEEMGDDDENEADQTEDTDEADEADSDEADEVDSDEADEADSDEADEADSDEDDEEKEEDEQDEDGKRRKRSARWGHRKPSRKHRRKHHGKPIRKHKSWSLGFYGLFQMTDRVHCDSGYVKSKNKCETACSAFTDDDITDDIECFVKTRLWRYILRTAPRWCRRIAYSGRYFDDCN